MFVLVEYVKIKCKDLNLNEHRYFGFTWCHSGGPCVMQKWQPGCGFLISVGHCISNLNISLGILVVMITCVNIYTLGIRRNINEIMNQQNIFWFKFKLFNSNSNFFVQI